MRKEKSKSGGSLTRRILTITSGLLVLMTLFVVLRPGVKPFTGTPTPRPTAEPYRLTGSSYLFDWVEKTTVPSVNNSDVVSASQRIYTNASISPLASAHITFVQLKTTKASQDAFYRPVLPAWFGVIEDAIRIENLNTNQFRVICTYLKPSPDETLSPDERPESNYPSCSFVAQYGSCILEASSTMHEPAVTPNDFKQLITENIDPQMAAWDVCYPDRSVE